MKKFEPCMFAKSDYFRCYHRTLCKIRDNKVCIGYNKCEEYEEEEIITEQSEE